MIISTETIQFIHTHINDDVRTLALGKHPAGVDLRTALVQISGYQYALSKLPEWAATDGILWPEHISLEQCTSQLLAQYKARIVDRLLRPGFSMADLTGGLGVDCLYLSRNAGRLCYNDANPELAELVGHNLPLLGRSDIAVSAGTAENFLSEHSGERFGLIYIDPSRRSSGGRKLVSLKDCMPDVTELQHRMSSMADYVIVKMSPMLDISVVLSELRNVRELWALSLDGECKELMAVIQHDCQYEAEIVAADITSDGTDSGYIRSTLSRESSLPLPLLPEDVPMEGKYLYEPSAAYMKSGLYRTLCHKYGLCQLHVNSHLYISDTYIKDFPGRRFGIISVFTFDKRSSRQLFAEHSQANITTRNFPLTAGELRNRYNVADGGPYYIFATTVFPDRKVLIMTMRPSE